MLLRTPRSCRVLGLTMLVLCFGSHHVASLRRARRANGNRTTEDVSLPKNFLMMLSLQGGVNQFDATIIFNKTSFEELYSCLCHKNTHSCSGNVTYNYGSSYSYNTENIRIVNTTTAASVPTKYKCDIPNFGFLSNNRGGYFSCVRDESTEKACTTDYSSIYIGQCDLESANIIWDPSHHASWNYSFYKNKSNRSVVSSCMCDAHGKSSCDTSTSVRSTTLGTTSHRDNDVTTNSLTSTMHATNEQFKETNNDAGIIGGTVSAVVVLAVLLVVGIVWRCKVLRQKNNVDKDINKLTDNEQSKQDNRNLHVGTPPRTGNGNPARLFAIPERGLKPDSDIPRWNLSRSKEEDDAASCIYDVIGRGVYENGINMNENTPNNNNNNTNKGDEKVTTDKHISNNAPNNKNPPINGVTPDNKHFNLTVTNSDYVPGYSKFGNKDNNIHNPQNKLPKQDVKLRERQPIPTEESASASRDSSAYSLGWNFQENYNFLNRPAEFRSIVNRNNNSDEPAGANRGQNPTLSSEFVYPLNIDALVRDDSPYFELDKEGFPYNEPSESGGTMPSQGGFQGFHDSFVGPRDSLGVSDSFIGQGDSQGGVSVSFTGPKDSHGGFPD